MFSAKTTVELICYLDHSLLHNPEVKEIIKAWQKDHNKLKRQIDAQAKSKIADFVNGYKESLKFDLEDAIEQQEQENNEDFNAGREEALKYAIEMIDKHLSDFSA